MLVKFWTGNSYVARKAADRRPASSMDVSNDNAHDVLPGSIGTSASKAVRDLRPIYVTTRDFGRLENLARIRLSAGDPVASFLLAELDRAIVVKPTDLPQDVVAINKRVIFRRGHSAVENRVLVYPHQYHPTGQYLSIMSPLGIALLGLREGSGMFFRQRDGAETSVRVEKVLSPPDG